MHMKRIQKSNGRVAGSVILSASLFSLILCYGVFVPKTLQYDQWEVDNQKRILDCEEERNLMNNEKE